MILLFQCYIAWGVFARACMSPFAGTKRPKLETKPAEGETE
jgi:hypothetical protein